MNTGSRLLELLYWLACILMIYTNLNLKSSKKPMHRLLPKLFLWISYFVSIVRWSDHFQLQSLPLLFASLEEEVRGVSHYKQWGLGLLMYCCSLRKKKTIFFMVLIYSCMRKMNLCFDSLNSHSIVWINHWLEGVVLLDPLQSHKYQWFLAVVFLANGPSMRKNSGKTVDHEEMIFIWRPYFVVPFTGVSPTKSSLKQAEALGQLFWR